MKFTNYFVRFTGHINERIRPEFFPKEVFMDYTLQQMTDDQLRAFVQERFADFVRQQGMVVVKKLIEHDESVLRFDSKMFVPMSIIAWLDVTATPLPELLPQEVAEGRVQLTGGETGTAEGHVN